MSYAIKTQVPVSRSQEEIRKVLGKYKATGFAFGEQPHAAMVMFEMQNRRMRFVLPFPPRPSPNATQATLKTYDQIIRSKWRSLTLAIKAKLECVESQISTLEEEFMANIVLPNGRTVGEAMLPQIEKSYKDGKMPPLLGYDK